MRRSGPSSSLWILATSLYDHNGGTTEMKAFFFSILDDHWDRIEKLVVEMDVDKVHPSHWRAIYTPAPRLQVFDFKLHHIPGESELSVGPLFDNVAPSLHIFRVNHIRLRSQAPWFSGIQSLDIRHSFTVAELLETLKMMPSLRSLHFAELSSKGLDAGITLPSVCVPELRTITLSLDIANCNTLLEHMTAERGCSLVIHDSRIGPQSSFPRGEILPLRGVSRFAEDYYHLRRPSMISLDISSRAFHFELPDLSAQGMQGFSISVRSHQQPLSAISVGNILSSCIAPSFRLLTEIELKCRGFFSADLKLDTALLALTGIHSLYTDERMLGYLLFLQERSSNIIFPQLKVVKVDLFHKNYFRADGYVLTFLRSRRDAGHPIHTLDLTQCNPDVSPRLMQLEEVTDLKIVWRMPGSDEIFEYECGSGHPEKIPFFYGEFLQEEFDVNRV